LVAENHYFKIISDPQEFINSKLAMTWKWIHMPLTVISVDCSALNHQNRTSTSQDMLDYWHWPLIDHLSTLGLTPPFLSHSKNKIMPTFGPDPYYQAKETKGGVFYGLNF
jgi:hypothetical protein